MSRGIKKRSTFSRIDMDASCRNDIILFGTKTCPNCIQAEKILNNAGINFVKILAEDKPELVASLKIMQTPTLIVRNRIKKIDERFVGVNDIYKFVNKEVKKKI